MDDGPLGTPSGEGDRPAGAGGRPRDGQGNRGKEHFVLPDGAQVLAVLGEQQSTLMNTPAEGFVPVLDRTFATGPARLHPVTGQIDRDMKIAELFRDIGNFGVDHRSLSPVAGTAVGGSVGVPGLENQQAAWLRAGDLLSQRPRSDFPSCVKSATVATPTKSSSE